MQFFLICSLFTQYFADDVVKCFKLFLCRIRVIITTAKTTMVASSGNIKIMFYAQFICKLSFLFGKIFEFIFKKDFIKCLYNNIKASLKGNSNLKVVFFIIFSQLYIQDLLQLQFRNQYYHGSALVICLYVHL